MINKVDRLYLLDIARAFAAICVVLQHYQHFYLIKAHQYVENFSRDQQPFYNLIEPAYKFGSVGVHFFFVLSGYIFFMYYRKKIAEKSINFNNFIILRLSRLYPLHLLTLIFMLFLQKIYFYFTSEYFVYENNDLINFFLHFFLIQEWGFVKSSWAFNAPSWSISVELLLYISFFFISLAFIKNLIQSFITLITAFILYSLIQPSLGNLIAGFVLFYLGGFTYYLCNFLNKFLDKRKNLIVILLVLVDILVFGRFLNQVFLEWQISLTNLIGERLMLLLFFVKFPLIIINLSIIQHYFKNIGKQIKILGDISYTIYLIHVPVQVIFALINKKIFNINFDNNLVFLLYFASVFFLSIITYKYFELPFKNYLRKKLIFRK